MIFEILKITIGLNRPDEGADPRCVAESQSHGSAERKNDKSKEERVVEIGMWMNPFLIYDDTIDEGSGAPFFLTYTSHAPHTSHRCDCRTD